MGGRRVNELNFFSFYISPLSFSCAKLYWSMKELEKPEKTPEIKQDDISLFVFRENNRPFHPERLAAILNPSQAGEKMEKAGVVRAKGSIWLANADAHPMNVQLENQEFEIEPNMSKPFLSTILDSVAKNDWKDTFSQDWLAQVELLQQSWQWSEASGDRASELVFFGVGMDKEAIEAGLKGALLTDDEISKGKESWKEFADPFFSGDMSEEEEEEDEDDDDEGDEEKEKADEQEEEEVASPPKRPRRVCKNVEA